MHFYGYPVIGPVSMGSMAIESFNYSELSLPADARGEDLLIEGRPGREPKDRLADDTRRIVEVRIRGNYNEDSTPRTGSVDDFILGYYEHLEKVKALVKARHECTLHVGTARWGGLVTVERMTQPRKLNPYSFEFALDVTIHGGGLAVEVAP